MRKLIFTSIFALSLPAFAQTSVVFNEGVTVQPTVNPFAMVINLDETSTLVLKNGVVLNPGVEKSIASVLVEVGNANLGSSSYFVSFNDSSIVLANEMVGATATVRRGGVTGNIIGIAPVISNNQGDSNSPVFTVHLSGTSLSSFTPSSTTINGIPNGTYPLEVHRGTGSGGAAQMVCTGASGPPYTGATCTPSVTAAGSYSVAPTINIWNGYTLGVFSSGSWPSGATVGDFVNIRQDYGPSTQAMLVATGWGISGTAIGETTDLPNDAALGDLPPGSANGQSMLVTGPTTITTSFDTGVPAQNLYQLVDPITASVTHKRVTGSGNISWSISRATAAGSGTGFSCSGTITPTTGTWVYASNFAAGCTTGETVGSGTGPIGQVNMAFTIPSGTTVELDNFYLAGASTGNATAFRDPVVTALVKFGGGTNIAPTRNLNNQMPLTFNDQIQPDNRSIPDYTFGDNCNNGQPLWSAGCIKAAPITWTQHLNLGEQYDGTVWDVTGVNWSQSDAQNAADFLGGSCATTGGALRCGQGHTTPYTSVYAAAGREIHMEPGNENWNTGGSGGKWRTVPQCPAGPNCPAAYQSGANTNAPYGFYVNTIATAFESQSSYNATVEKFELGLQTSGSNTTFGADNLFKSTSTAGTPFVTAATNIDFAPYINFQPTSAGFDTAAFSRQIQSDLANAYWQNNVSSSTLGIPVLAYPAHPSTIYEMNGGMTSLAATGVPTQQQVNGYQNSLGGGLADVIMLDEGCTRLKICDFRAHFVLLQQYKAFNNSGTTINVTATSANGSNVLTGVTVTANMVAGQNVTGLGLAGVGSPDGNGTAQIWVVGTNTLTLSRNVNCVSHCGSNTFTMNNIVTNLWGGAIGIGAQKNNNLLPFMQFAQNENTYAIKYGSTEFQSVYTSPTLTFPSVGTCPTACNGTPALSRPVLNIYGRKLGTFRSYTFYNTSDTTQVVNFSGNSLTGTVTMAQTGAGNNWQDTNQATMLVSPVVTSVSMPSSLTLPAHTQTILSGSIGTPTAVSPSFAPPAGTYGTTQLVALSSSTPSSVIYYTTNGTTPTTSSPVYSTPISVSVSLTIKAFTAATGYLNSAIVSASYVITPPAATPTFAPPAGTYTSSQAVTITSTTPSASIFYSFDNVTFNLYTGPVTVSMSSTLYAYATAAGFTQSATSSAPYTISLPQVALPIFSLPAGTYLGPQTVVITDTTPSSSIFYTVDGSTPTPSSTLYTGPVSIPFSLTLKAIATATGFSNSPVASAAYTIFTVAPGVRLFGTTSVVGNATVEPQ